MFTRTGMTSPHAGKGSGSGLKNKIMKGIGLTAFMVLCFAILSSVTVTTANAADACLCVSCHGTNHHADWSACTNCHGTLSATHSKHGAALSNTTYGDAVASDAGNYKFGCGHCHSLAVTTVAAHTATRTPNMELYNPNAAKRGQGPDQICSDCHGSSGPHGAECSSDGNSSECLSCHSIKQGSTNPVIQGLNHHSGVCLTCHDTGAPNGLALHDNSAPITTNASCLNCHAASGPNSSHHAVAAVTQTCTECHVNPGVAMSGDTCGNCHNHSAEAILKYNMPGTTCTSCHTVPGVRPVTSGSGSVCRTCHPSGSYDAYATNMHLTKPTANFAVTANGLTANVDGAATSCPVGKTCTYDYDWSDSTTHGATQSGSHAYATGGTKTITLTVGLTDSVAISTVSKTVTLTQPNGAPVAAFAAGSPSASGWTISVTDNSTDPDGAGDLSSPTAITVMWGDGASSRTTRGGTVTHAYTVANTYTVSLKATDAAGLSSTVTAPVTIALGTVSGTVKTALGANVNLAKVTITVAGVVKTAYTNTSGVYTIANVKPGTGYPMSATSGSTTYATQAWVTTGTAGTVNSGPNTVNFTP